jgi:hypothetical protein
MTDLADLITMHELDRLSIRYALAIDDRRYEELRSLLADDCHVDLADDTQGKGNRDYGDADSFVRSCRGMADRYVRTMHTLGQRDITVAGDTATGNAYCLVNHLRLIDGALVNQSLGIRYSDTYARVDGTWLFTRRTMRVEWTDERPVVGYRGHD